MSDDDEYYSNAGSDSDSEPEITKKSILKPKLGLVPGGLKKMEVGATIDDDDEDSDSEVLQIGGIGDDDEPEVDIMSNVSSDDDASEVAESDEESEEEDEEVGEEAEPGENEVVATKKASKGKAKKAVQIELHFFYPSQKQPFFAPLV